MSYFDSYARQRLIQMANRMVRESGDGREFDAEQWVDEWINNPVPALGGQLPRMYLDTPEGCEMVLALMLKMQTGAYA